MKTESPFEKIARLEQDKKVKRILHGRKMMLNHLKRKGLSLQSLGFPPSDYETPPVVVNKRPQYWPPGSSRKRFESGFKPCTAHTKEEKALYSSSSRLWLVGKICVVALTLDGKSIPATHCHHIFGRAGRLLMWEGGWLPTTGEGDKWIHQHPEEAQQRGWIASLEDWNDETIIDRWQENDLTKIPSDVSIVAL